MHKNIDIWSQYWNMVERLDYLFDGESQFEIWWADGYKFEGMRNIFTQKQHGLVRCWEPGGMITVYTAKNNEYHGLLINFGLGSSIRVTLYNNGRREDTFYIDTQTARKQTCVDGGNGKLMALRKLQLLDFEAPYT